MTATTNDAAPTADTAAPVDTTTSAATESATPQGSTDTPQADTTTPEPAATPTPEVPETYTFSMPDGMELDTEVADAFTPLLKKHGLTQDAANELASAYAEVIAKKSAGSEQLIEQAIADRIAQQTSADMDRLRSDTEIGGEKFDGVRAQVVAFLEQHGTPEFRAFNDKFGLGNNPEVVRVLHRALHARPIDTGAMPAGGGGVPRRASIAERMFGGRQK
jgi:hypothetical protein